MNHKLYTSTLYLQDNTYYKGWSFLKNFTCHGEIIFNTGMTGYQEVMTDPSYAGQIVTFTYPELGNTGFNHEDNESNVIHAKAIIAKNISKYSSNWRSIISLKDYLIKYDIPHIFGIDTRSLTKHLRKKGVMNCTISNELYTDNLIVKYYNIQNIDLVDIVSTKINYQILNDLSQYIDKPFSYLNSRIYTKNNDLRNYNIIVLDCGAKHNIFRRLLIYGCNIYVLSAHTPYSRIQMYNPDGIVLSNGPGDPSILLNVINNIKKIVYFSNIPIFGICMGHQLLNLSLDVSTYKLKFGHRGLNHPIGLSKRAEITSQNHGFVADKKSLLSLKDHVKLIHFNLNDNTLAGMVYKNKPIFSVQYHPEANPGPHDSDYLFKIFIDLIRVVKMYH